MDPQADRLLLEAAKRQLRDVGSLVRERVVLPRRQIVRDTISRGIERGEIRADRVGVERILDLLLGALFLRRAR